MLTGHGFEWWDALLDPWQVVMFRMSGELTNFYLASRSVNSLSWDGILPFQEYQRIQPVHRVTKAFRNFTNHMFKVRVVQEDDGLIIAYQHIMGEKRR